MNSQGANPTTPAYAHAWQVAQQQNDWSFRQQFGTEAFIAAQLAQVHSVAPATQ
jgi:hypothetical protein